MLGEKLLVDVAEQFRGNDAEVVIGPQVQLAVASTAKEVGDEAQMLFCHCVALRGRYGEDVAVEPVINGGEQRVRLSDRGIESLGERFGLGGRQGIPIL